MVSNNLLEFASKYYDFDVNTLEHIPRSNGKIMNQIYSFYKNNMKCLLKFEPPSIEHNNQLRETRAAMDFHYYLSENNINVSVPLKSTNGELVLQMQDDGVDYIITAFTWLNGRIWGFEANNAKMSFNWGKAMGDMHRAAKDYKPPNENDVQKDIFNCHYWGSFFDDLKAYPNVYKITQELLGEITVLPRDRDSFGVIHSDMHQGNIFINGDEVNIIDFGDSIYGWFALDVAISLCHALWWDRKDNKGNDLTNSIIKNFIKGYLSANQLSDFWISKILMFMKYRHICMNPENNLDGSREEWIYNIENDILFDERTLKSISDIIEWTTLKQKILTQVLPKMFGKNITCADYQTTKLYGWVCDDVRLIAGIAETDEKESLPFKVVLKKQRKVRPPLDSEAWIREYDFYASDFYKILDEQVDMPECYYSEFSGDAYVLWLEYIEEITGDNLTTDDMEYIAERLGSFHGKIYSQPNLTENFKFLFNNKHMEKKIKSWYKSSEYNYLRSEAFDAPEHLKRMLIENDDNQEAVLEKMKCLPIVLYHGDFHAGNIFLRNSKVILFDFGHFAGWGYLCEDIANLISDNEKYELWGEYYRKFVPAYLRGFSEYADISEIKDFCIREMILLNYGYDIVKKYKSAHDHDEREKLITALQAIYEMDGI